MNTAKNDIIAAILTSVEIPDTAYETAERRYKDVAAWFGTKGTFCEEFDPHIYPQGSFRLGTVIRPLKEEDEYDLDMSCQLERGFNKDSKSQAELKALVGRDLETYRLARGIEKTKEEKNRCWRLRYKDELRFHMDVVPCLPESVGQKKAIREAMVRFGVTDGLAQAVADLSVNITDRNHPHFEREVSDWLISNPEGYARWFESRMKLAGPLLESRMREARAATIDALPAYRWKSPLQQSVQLLKRHRDVMFSAAPDAKPISIIISTLAARSYNGESDVSSALENILASMDRLVSAARPHVPNPVNPLEDFADKWDSVEGRRLQLERNFRLWVAQARVDFDLISSSDDPNFIVEQAKSKFSAQLDSASLRRKLTAGFPAVIATPKRTAITEAPARPWQS